MEDRAESILHIENVARNMRRKILDMALAAGASSSHFGGGLSITDITATLYGSIMRYDLHNPEWTERDRFILSKGHGVLGYYTALSEIGYIPENDLLTFEKTGSYLLGHPVINRQRGIEFSNGSLGMGLSLGIGVALAGKRRNKKYKTYVLMGDGECNEGSVWEGVLAAPQFELNNLVAIFDRNNFQQTGSSEEIMNVGNLADKLDKFGWQIAEIDGHNIGELYDAFRAEQKSNKPLAVIAHTIKGKGFSFSENNNAWHHAILSKKQHEMAMEELERY